MGHSGPVSCGQISHDGNFIVTGGGEEYEPSLKVWNAGSGSCLVTVQNHHSYHSAGEPIPVALSEIEFCQRAFVTSASKIWATSCLFRLAGLTVLAIHSNDKLACTGSEDHTACLVNLQTGRVTGTFKGSISTHLTRHVLLHSAL